jgi:cytidylate kinase
MIVAIDGPSGAGKGTVARTVAERLGYRHVDTGAMYRAVAWRALQDHLSLDDEAAVSALAVRAALGQQDGRITIDGHDVTRAIRTPEMDRAAASVAKLPAVRRVLVQRQQALGADGNVVMEGRDIGSVVFPDAPVKIYLDASPAERARRRATDTAHTGGSHSNIATVEHDLLTRDQTDSTRAVAPLTLAPGAIYIDTTMMPIDSVVNQVLALVRARLETE